MLAVAELTLGVLATSAPVYRPFLHWASGRGKQGSTGSGFERNTPVAAWRNDVRSEASRGISVAPLREFDRSITVTAEFELSTQKVRVDDGSWHQIPDPNYHDTDHLFARQ